MIIMTNLILQTDKTVQPTINFSRIPAELKDYNQWVLWKYEESSSNGKTRISKKPYTTAGRSAIVSDSATLDSFENTVEAFGLGNYSGIGFAFTDADPFCGIDYDHVTDMETGEFLPDILEEISSIGSYAERSPSGEGAHVIIKGSVPGIKNRSGCREIYDRMRYFTVTGNHIAGTPFDVNEASREALDNVYGKIDPMNEKSNMRSIAMPTMPDFEIVDKCRRAKNASNFNALYEGRWETLGYPSQSEADLALCSIIAFYTQDPMQIDRIFSGSGLNSEKWDRQDYRERTISKALQKIAEDPQKKFFTEKRGFIVKALAEAIMGEHHFITMDDTKEICVYENGIYHPGGENLIRKLAQGKLQDYSKKGHLNEVLYYIQNETMVNRDALNADSHIINLKNGLYDVKRGKFMVHNPAVLSTIQIPVEFNPDVECPTIDKFLSDIVSEENKQVLIEWIGYSMIADYSIQKSVMLIGSGSNGKSVFLNMLREFIGNDNCSGESLQHLETDKYSTANLYGKLLNVCPDIPESSINDNSVFKMLTGNEQRVRAERKYQNAFEFKNTARLIFSANEVPLVRNGNHAYFRRWILIEFPNQFKGNNADRNLLDKLTTDDELSGLLNRALIALKMLLERSEFSYSKTESEVERMYRIKSDSVASFADECVKMSDDNTLKIVMYDAYTKWCKKYGLKVVASSVFGMRFKSLGHEYFRETAGDRKYFWEGISVSLV
jgi:phage/plasmid primase, P4 family, C-terminal domain